jgi:hypothetical protein
MSVELQKLRGEIMRESLAHGWTHAGDVPAPWNTMVDAQRLRRWFDRLYEAPSEPTPVGPRLVNHFKLGADPEFVFMDAGNTRYDATNLNLKAGPAFGADNNGRLVELRAHPSRSALSVLASLWLAMRWMEVFEPKTLQFGWRSGAYFENDGLGGHIHFGRKRRKLFEREVMGLDRITHLAFTAGIFDREEGRLRVRQSQGAPYGHKYGELSDTRSQPHGYEYRTLPSWIDNPWLAYFALVVSKLVVAFPELVAPLVAADASLSTEQARSQLRFILAYYAPTDDDARLAHAILARQGFPRHANGMDIKGSWGIFPSVPFGKADVTARPSIYPSTVPPTPATERELAEAMFTGRVPEALPLEPTWTPSALPSGYIPMITQTVTKVAPGLGEFVMPLCRHKDTNLSFRAAGNGRLLFRFPNNYANNVINSRLMEKLGLEDAADYQGDPDVIWVNTAKEISPALLERCRDVIIDSGAFPLWRTNEVKPESFANWNNRFNVVKRSNGAKVILGANKGGF